MATPKKVGGNVWNGKTHDIIRASRRMRLVIDDISGDPPLARSSYLEALNNLSKDLFLIYDAAVQLRDIGNGDKREGQG